MKKTTAQKEAQKKYINKGKILHVFFPCDRMTVYEYTKKKAAQLDMGMATYIKNILETDMRDSNDKRKD